MTVHYHGTPITPRLALLQLHGRSFCVSHANPQDVSVCHSIGESVMLDNGAFSHWTAGREPNWEKYYEWCEKWLDYHTTWAVIPDTIDGGEEYNDILLFMWPFAHRGAPVWHVHEPIDRLRRLCDEWPRVCIGSSGEYSRVNSPEWRARMDKAMDVISCEGRIPAWLHMLRGFSVLRCGYPFASADSTDIGRNHKRPQNDAVKMAIRWDAMQCPGKWVSREIQELLV